MIVMRYGDKMKTIAELVSPKGVVVESATGTPKNHEELAQLLQSVLDNVATDNPGITLLTYNEPGLRLRWWSV